MLHLMIYTTPSRMGEHTRTQKIGISGSEKFADSWCFSNFKNFYSDEKHPGKRQILLKNCEELENGTITYRNNRDLRLGNGNCP